jgi:hypothetical protein
LMPFSVLELNLTIIVLFILDLATPIDYGLSVLRCKTPAWVWP